MLQASDGLSSKGIPAI